MDTYRVGIAGLGQVGLLYEEDPRIVRRYPYPTHAAAFAAHPRTRLVAAADPEEHRLELARARYGVPGLYRDYRLMLEQEALDILSVCVPAALHGDVVPAALDAGVRMIFCEKPFTLHLEAARFLTERCRGQGGSIVVNYFRRFDASHREIAGLLARGELGAVQRVSAVYGNGMMNNGAHLVNLLLWYLGPAAWVAALAGSAEADGGQPDLAIGFESGVLATLLACSYEHYRILEIDIFTARGRVTIANEGLDLRVHGVRPNAEVSGTRQLAPRPRRLAGTVGTAFLAAIDHLVGALDRGEQLLPADALETHAVLEAARASARAGGARIEVGAVATAGPVSGGRHG